MNSVHFSNATGFVLDINKVKMRHSSQYISNRLNNNFRSRFYERKKTRVCAQRTNKNFYNDCTSNSWYANYLPRLVCRWSTKLFMDLEFSRTILITCIFAKSTNSLRNYFFKSGGASWKFWLLKNQCSAILGDKRLCILEQAGQINCNIALQRFRQTQRRGH